MAREHRRQFSFPVIGITGTNGKTTTKELISAVLAKKYNVVHTEANYNNDVGVPRTLLTFRPEHEIAVVEMGASHPGDIKKLVEYVEPTCGLITNVGRAHLQGFGSFEGVPPTTPCSSSTAVTPTCWRWPSNATSRVSSPMHPTVLTRRLW